MAQNNKLSLNIIKIVIAMAIYLAGLFLIYFIGFGRSLATASGNMNYMTWKNYFVIVAIAVGLFTMVMALIWAILTAKVFTVNSTKDMGRRNIWAILALVSFFGAPLTAEITASIVGIKISFTIVAIFAIISLFGYWIVSIFTTASAFKYTPIGAEIFLNGR